MPRAVTRRQRGVRCALREGARLEDPCTPVARVHFDDALHRLTESPGHLREREHGDFDAVLLYVVRDALRHAREDLDGLAAPGQRALALTVGLGFSWGEEALGRRQWGEELLGVCA
jgi:hypothetical protein